MAGALRILVLGVALATVAASTPQLSSTARAAGLDRKGKADAKEAMALYKEGNYEDAARLFLRLSINYPDMLVFVRNIGACYYYMRRYEPALSNLRDYLHRKADIAADDRAEVSGWIGEMERLRDQQSAPPPVAPAPVAPAVPAPPATAPVPVPVPTPSLPAAPGVPGAGEAAAAPTPVAPAVPAPTTPIPPVVPATASAPIAAPSPAAPAAEAPAAATPSPAPAPPSTAQPPYAPAYGYAPYGTQPGHGQAPYPGQPAPYGQQGYPPPYGQPGSAPYGYGPAYPGYAPAGAPGVGMQARPPQGGSTGRKVAAWMLGIVGVGGLGGGGYLTYLAKQRFDDVEVKYDRDKESQGKRYVIGAGICYGAGGALLLTAIIVGATGGSAGPVALAPVVGPSMAGASLGGSF